jgi:T5orf172 domain
VSRDATAAATTYVLRFGGRNVWKIGHAQDVESHLAEVNKHIPYDVLGERWSVAWHQIWPKQTAAYEMEQRVLAILAARRTEGERVTCTEDEIRAAWICAMVPVRQAR